MHRDNIRNFSLALTALLQSVRNGTSLYSSDSSDTHAASTEQRRSILRFSRKFESCDLLEALSSLECYPAFYWRSSDGALETVGLGRAETFLATSEEQREQVFSDIESRLASAPSTVKYYGGMRFDSRIAAAEEWQPFGVAMFTLPRVEIIEQGGSAYVAINVLAEQPLEEQLHEVDQILLQALNSVQIARPCATSSSREDNPDHNGWNSRVREVLSILEGASRAQKIVLSRCTRLGLTGPIAASEIVSALIRSAPRSYGFIFSPQPGVSFLGASPERLFHRKGARVVSEALAGTTIRGTNQEHDQILAHDLLSSRKNRVEHQLVVDAIVRQLGSLCASQLITEETTTVKTGSVQHLVASIQGVVRAGVSDWDLISALHPTPAVAGTPTEVALRFIAENEQHDRGWYAGPVGFIGKEESELAVALRCALIQATDARLYVGAGLVSGSDESSEWNELEAKVSPYLRLLIDGERYA